MKNKVLKNVVLFACILGLVLFQVDYSFATMSHFSGGSGTEDDPFTYDSLEDFVLDCPLFSTSIVKPNQSAEPYINDALEYFNITEPCAINVSNYGITMVPFSNIVSFNSNVFVNTGRYWCLFNSNGEITSHVEYTNQQSLSLSDNQLPHYYIQSIPDMIYNGVYVISAPPTPPDPTQRPNYSYPNYPIYIPSVPTDWSHYAEMMAGLFYDNFRFECNDTIYNPNWISVGEYLTYDFLCKNNPDLETVSFNDYEYTNYIHLLISSTGTVQDISDRLALAFPDDQAELNDSIAETLLDDTNNTGLTAEKVSNAKSDFDDGISTYEIDTSGSAYSTPFAAIRGGDWSFWSQTTLDNMGSGYSYTYQQTRNKKASNDSDIYEENSKSLFDLLGW